MKPTPILCSIQVGLPRKMGVEHAANPMERPWESGIFKTAVVGPVWLGRENLAGDGQADLRFHGGTDKAILAYGADHYEIWRAELPDVELPYGAFGENFTISGLTELDVCIGDTYAIGDVLVQVSEPRQPCWKQARRLMVAEMVKLIHRSGRSGWYLRVLQEGFVEAGMPVILRDRPYPNLTITRLQAMSEDLIPELLACPLLSESFRSHFKDGD